MSVNTKRALGKVAEQHGVTVEQVQKEIEQFCAGYGELEGLDAEQIVDVLVKRVTERLAFRD